jgi:hypothetical protein
MRENASGTVSGCRRTRHCSGFGDRKVPGREDSQDRRRAGGNRPSRPLKKAGLMENGKWEMAKCSGFFHFPFAICYSGCVFQHPARRSGEALARNITRDEHPPTAPGDCPTRSRPQADRRCDRDRLRRRGRHGGTRPDVARRHACRSSRGAPTLKETVSARIRQDRKYRKELLREGVECARSRPQANAP